MGEQITMITKLWLAHTGTPQRFDFDPHGSGRYREGSGENPHQHDPYYQFKAEVDRLYSECKAAGSTDPWKDTAKALGFNSSMDLRAKEQYLRADRERDIAYTIRDLREKSGMSFQAIADKLGLKNESTARSMYGRFEKIANNQLYSTCDVIRERIKERGFIDVGEGTAQSLGLTETKLRAALQKLKDEGYGLYTIKEYDPTNPKHQTNKIVIGPEGTTRSDAYNAQREDNIHLIKDLLYSPDGGLTYREKQYPTSLDSNRIQISYADKDGYQPKDGVIELRPGVEDISLGGSRYAQVRILVDDKYYLKGMAVYSDDLPKGVDVRFNSNKPAGTDKSEVFKKIDTNPTDPTNPFGATIKEFSAGGQRYYTDKNGVEHLSVINKVNDEGDWDAWGKTLASQFLHKQNYSLVKGQMDLTYQENVYEFDHIKEIQNSAIKKKLLYDFAESCDASACNLKAKALPGQRTQVLLPSESVGMDEIYAPNFEEGRRVCLIRYPHSGPFEILDLKVNNHNPTCEKIYGKNPVDCVVVNPKNLPILSGADCDGDTATIIYNNNKMIRSTKTIPIHPALLSVKDFDNKREYPFHEGIKTYTEKGKTGLTMTAKMKGREMGKTTNLLADMSELGAPPEDIAKVAKYNMVVIDAYKHKLDWRQAYKDFNIAELTKKWKKGTIITETNKVVKVDEYRPYTKIDPQTGEKILEKSGKTFVNKKGEEVSLKENVKQALLPEYKDSFKLTHDPNNPTPIERVYAEYSNNMKDLGNQARLEWTKIKADPVNENASKAYEVEKDSLLSKLKTAELYAPYERKARSAAKVIIREKVSEDPSLKDDDDRYKKVKQQAMATARRRTVPGGKKYQIVPTDREWDAITSNAFNHTTTKKIIDHMDPEEWSRRTKFSVSERSKGARLSDWQKNYIEMLSNIGWTRKQIAEKLNVSEGTVSNVLNA